MQRLGYVPALDGVRCIAISLVIGFHFFGLTGGTSGVDVFFVLSGFLITTILLEERNRTGRMDFRAFYGRRVRRLAPALAVMIATYLAITAALGENRLLVVLAGVFYSSNIVLASGSHLFDGSHVTFLWSLAQEEQFYLVWPALLLLAIRSRRPLVWVVVGYLVLSAWRAGLTIHGAPTYRIYDGPDTRATGLIAGSALAIFRQSHGFKVGEWAGQLGACVLLVGAFFGWAVGQWPIVGVPVFEIGVCLLIAAALSETSVARALAKGPLVWIGKRSYSLYLWQSAAWACVFVFGAGLLATLTGLVLAVVCASLSYRFVEQRFRRRRSSSSEPSLIPSAATAAL
jgi:peptidoglycan/LPS O-acetylase OafA/YrhL